MPVDEDPSALRTVERHHQADQRALARAARSDERGRRSRRRAEADALQHRHALVVLEADVLERDLAVDRAERLARAVLVVLGLHRHQVVDAIEAGECFADLRADRGDLHDRRRHQPGEEDVVHEVAERHASRDDRRGRRRRS